MNTLQIAPLSDMTEHQTDVLAMTNSGPVALVEKQQVAGVLLSPDQWNAITQTLEAAQACLAATQASVNAT